MEKQHRKLLVGLTLLVLTVASLALLERQRAHPDREISSVDQIVPDTLHDELPSGNNGSRPGLPDTQASDPNPDRIDELLADYKAHFAAWQESNGAILDEGRTEAKLTAELRRRILLAINRKYRLRPAARGMPADLDVNLEEFRMLPVGGPIYYEGGKCTRCLDFTFAVSSRDGSETYVSCDFRIFLARSAEADVLIGDLGKSTCFEPKTIPDEASAPREIMPAPIERRPPQDGAPVP